MASDVAGADAASARDLGAGLAGPPPGSDLAASGAPPTPPRGSSSAPPDDVASPSAAALSAPPSWFDRDAFTRPDFDAGSYVEEMSARVDADELKSELETHRAALESQLVSCVHRDYARFLALSDAVASKDIPRRADEWEAPIATFRAEVAETRAEVSNALADMREKLAKRAELAEKRATLELALDAANVASKVERLLDELEKSAAEEEEEDDEKGERAGGGGPEEANETENGWAANPAAGADAARSRAAAAAAKKKQRPDDEHAAKDLEALGDDSDSDDSESSDAAFSASAAPLEPEDEAGLDALRLRFEGGGEDAAALALAADDTTKAQQPRTGEKAQRSQRLETRARLLERISGEANRLAFFRREGTKLAFIRALAPRVDQCDRRLATATREATRRAATARSAAALAHCLRAHVAQGARADAEAAILELVASPAAEMAAEKTLQSLRKENGSERTHADNGDADEDAPPTDGDGATPGGGGTPGFASFLSAAADAALRACDVELALTRDPDSGLGEQYEFYSSAVLAATDLCAKAHFPNAFSPGNPAAFRANYAASRALIDRLEALVPSASALAAFRASDAFGTHKKRWNAKAYFALRFREITRTVDAELLVGDTEGGGSGDGVGGGAPVRAASGSSPFALAAFAAAEKATLRCFAEDVFLDACADQLVKLAAQIASRLAEWTRANAVASGTLQATAAGKGGAEDDASAAEDASDASREGVPDDAHSAKDARGWSEEDAALARGDVDRFAAFLASDATAAARGRVEPTLGAAAADAAGECLRLSASGMRSSAGDALDSALVAAVASRCASALSQLKGIVATFRVTNKPAPTRRSHFVPSVTAPLRAFGESASARALEPATRAAIVRGAAEKTAEAYADAAVELVAGVKKTEASLSRLKDRKEKAQAQAQAAAAARGGEGGLGGGDHRGVEEASGGAEEGSNRRASGAAGSAATMSTDEKVRAQLKLDAAEFGANLAGVGAEPEKMDAFKRLWRVAEGEES